MRFFAASLLSASIPRRRSTSRRELFTESPHTPRVCMIHNHEVAGSFPAPATKESSENQAVTKISQLLFFFLRTR
jgi:hypothetical protein